MRSGGRGALRTRRDHMCHTLAGLSPSSGGRWIPRCLGSKAGTPGEVPGPHVWARESSSRPPFPSRYLARSFLVTSPTTCGSKARSWDPAASASVDASVPCAEDSIVWGSPAGGQAGW